MKSPRHLKQTKNKSKSVDTSGNAINALGILILNLYSYSEWFISTHRRRKSRKLLTAFLKLLLDCQSIFEKQYLWKCRTPSMQTSVAAESSVVQVRAAPGRCCWQGNPGGWHKGKCSGALGSQATASLSDTICRFQVASWLLSLFQEKLFSRSVKAKNKLRIKVPNTGKSIRFLVVLKNSHPRQILAFIRKSLFSFSLPQ